MPANALDRITIEGFKSLRSVDLSLRRINVLIGPNGSGKSNFIGVLAFLHEVRQGRLQAYVAEAGGAERLLHFGSKTTGRMRFHLSFRGGVNQYELTLAPTRDDSLYVDGETVFFHDKLKHSDPFGVPLVALNGAREAGISGNRGGEMANWVQLRLDGLRPYHVSDTSASSPMRKTADIHDNRLLRPDGSNSAAFLYLLQEKHKESYEAIRSVIRRVAPFFDDFSLSPLRLNPDTIRLEWKHRQSDQYFDASSLSDGTLRFVALATLLLQPESYRPSLIVVDEPELGLHPAAIELLASLVRQASRKTQVVLSTQSSLFLDHFDPEDVLVASRQQNATTFERLQPEHLAAWLTEYSLGQLWEKNEIGGRPEPG